MPDEPNDVNAQLLMLMHVTSALWANFINNSGPNPIGTCQRVAKESLATLDDMYGRLAGAAPSPNLHPLIQAILHHEEGFWKQVEEQVRRTQG